MRIPLHRRLSRVSMRLRHAACLGAVVTGAAVVLLMAMPMRAQDGPSQQPGEGEDQGQAAQADPPSQVARVSVVVGNVSVEPASVNQFSAAEVNYPLTTGDRLYADVGANAELQTDQLAVRLGQQTDLTVTAMTDTLAQFGLAQGGVHLRSYSLDPDGTVELDTPNVAVTLLQAGDVRVDVDPDSGTTTVLVDSGEVQVDGNGLQQVLEAGQRMRVGGSDPVSAQWLDGASLDGLDRFSMDRDVLYDSSTAGESQYVSPDTIGAGDLASNGDWETDSDEGPVWYPTGVAVDWQPYSCGRWAWVAPWGWTWVDCAPWGFAPFHYGRWEHRGRRWGWIPGPPVVRPVYSPALVVFVGGDRLNPGGGPVTAWFPLGPREPYVPWYHASQRYVNRVNVSNIYDRNTEQVRNIYDQRTEVAAYAGGGERVYANRPVGTVAVPESAFAAGRRVGSSMVRVNPQELAAAKVLPHPLVTPQRTMVVAAPARALPPHLTRPTLATTQGDSRIRPSARPVIEGSQPNYQHEAAPIARQPAEGMRNQQPVPQQRPGYQQPVQQQGERPGYQQPAQPEPVRPNYQHEAAPAGRQPAEAVRPQSEAAPVAPAAPPRMLYNRAVPPAPRPSFEEQQRAIQSIDPGRPLGPQQMNNLRQNQPVGPPQQREMPHPPVGAPRPAPAPRSAPPTVVHH